MAHVRRFFRRLYSFMRPGRAEEELAREVEAHRGLLEEEFRRRGLPPDEARIAAVRAFGSLEASKELQRNERSFLWLEDLRQDLRFAFRLLVRTPGFTLVALSTLAISIAANAAVFTVVHSVLLRPLPYPDPDRLVFSYDSFPNAGVDRAGTSIPNYLDRLRTVTAFESAALYRWEGFRMGDGASAEEVTALEVTPSFFRVLRVRPGLGRTFTEEEGTEGRNRVAVLSFELWRQAFGSAPDVIGRDVRLSGESYRVVGVMPASFTFLSPSIRLWVPAAFTAEQRSEASRYSQNHEQIARLAPGATLAQAQQQIDALNVRHVERAGDLRPLLVNAGYRTRLLPLEQDLVRGVRAPLQFLWGGALLVLFIASANLTNLVLVRATSRTRELVTRRALGAGERRIARQLLAETMLLTLCGGLLGLALGGWSLAWLSALNLQDLPRGHEIRLDWTVTGITLGIAALQGLMISVAPLAQLAGLTLDSVLREEGRTTTVGRGVGLIRRGLVTIQVALAFVLLIGAGLLFASFRALLAVDPGFRVERLLTGSVGLAGASYENEAQRIAFVDRALEGLRRLPGVQAVAGTTYLPFGYTGSSSAILVEGYAPAPGESIVSPSNLTVTPGYFEALGIPLRRGRFFTPADDAGAPRVVIIDERLARKYWGDRDPIGGRLFQPENAEEVTGDVADDRWITVVGVVGEVKLKELVEGEETRIGAYYFPYAQNPVDFVSFVVRTTEEPMALAGAARETLVRLDPELLLADVQTMGERIERSLHARRTPMLLSMAFGVVALVLAIVGIYGVLAYHVSQRTREIGIHMALGCDSASVLRLVIREGAILVLIGLTAGIAGVVALRHVIASQLYGVGVLDPVVVVSVGGTLLAAALLACLVPARRASRVNPVVALTAL